MAISGSKGRLSLRPVCVVLNAVRAVMVKRSEEWRWSSGFPALTGRGLQRRVIGCNRISDLTRVSRYTM